MKIWNVYLIALASPILKGTVNAESKDKIHIL